MGREVRRVPIDFDWPLNKVWRGFLMPESLSERPCDACDGQGTTDAREALARTAYLLLMLDDDLECQQRGRPLHPYFQSFFYGPRPSADIREFGVGLAGRSGGWGGHDSIDQWHALDAIIRAAGLDPEVWGLCPTCQGHGSLERYPGQRADADAWEPTDPPEGEGWQYWETVSEGSPISPVFATAEALSHWLQTDYRWGSGGPLTKEQADSMVQTGWAPSFIVDSTGLHRGEEVAAST